MAIFARARDRSGNTCCPPGRATRLERIARFPAAANRRFDAAGNAPKKGGQKFKYRYSQGIGVYFFQRQNSFKPAYFEEKIHRKGEEGRGKKGLKVKPSSPYSPSR
jgi:hypothetical protein